MNEFTSVDPNSVFTYEDGSIYSISNTLKGRWRKGRSCGTEKKSGYWYVYFNGKLTLRHRIIWIMHNGPIPKGMVIDHINDIRGDDRIENLQMITSSQNSSKTVLSKNISLRTKNGSSGFKGITMDKRNKKWRARIFSNGKSYELGVYENLSDAVLARCNAELNHNYMNVGA